MSFFSPRRSSASVAAFLLLGAALHAQIPTKCFEIENILVDACNSGCPGAQEGQNEMVRFFTGPYDIDIALMDGTWPLNNNPWRGLVQNATTANLTAALNATVEGCGELLEPPGGIIPPGSHVVLVTSTDMCVASNSFAGLNETLYIIFQAPGTTQGHFANYNSSPGLRSVILRYPSTACGDTATYDRSLLIDQGGLPAAQDGASVAFSWPGVPFASYYNFGCQAPIVPLTAEIVSGAGPIPCGSTVSLTGEVSSVADSYFWSGGTGTFSTPTALGTTYTPGPGDGAAFTLEFCGVSACGDTICDQVQITVEGEPEVTITGDTTLCGSLETTVLTASGADTYVWSTGATGPSITVDIITAFPQVWVVGTNACGSDSAFTHVTSFNITTYYEHVSCNGANDGGLTVQPFGGDQPYSITWTDGNADLVRTGLAPGAYSFTITDGSGCTTGGGYTITEPTPLVAEAFNDTTICAGGYALIGATISGGTPAYDVIWSPEGPVVFPTQTTTYSMVISDQNGCTLPPQEMTVFVGGATAAFTHDAQPGCAPVCVTFTATTVGTEYDWQFGDGGTAQGQQVEYCFSAPGAHDVTLVVGDGSAGCPSSVTVPGLVQVQPAPSVTVAAWPISGEAPLPVQFNAAVTPALPAQWDLGDGTSDTGAQVSHTYDQPGVYEVVVTAEGACTGRDTIWITVLEPIVPVDSSWVTIPNVFTPNRDGHNDLFRVDGEGLLTLSVDIFNRWGQLVGRLTGVSQGWDGRSEGGEPVPEGTYFIVLDAQGVDGRTYAVQQAITLLR
ncbi:MAG TPA: PKD domain-containing protein [Flavobacteriales bacterium]